MDKRTQDAWKHEALEMVFAALANSPTPTSRLIFKGARVLNRLLRDDSRQSLDLDANLRDAFLREYPDREERRTVLEQELSRAVADYLAAQPETPYTLESVSVDYEPSRGTHPLGWDGMKARLRLRDARRPQVIGLQALEIDFSAPEPMGPHGTATLRLDHGSVEAESLARITAEKMRAFLQSLPAWRSKTGGQPRAVRVRDLYDLKRVAVAKPLSQTAFWDNVGELFKIACESRFVDCEGISTFAEQLDVTRATFDNDATMPKNWSFDELWLNLEQIVERLERSGVIPLKFHLPDR